MKKIVSILLAMVFLLTSFGFTINNHYCKMKASSTVSIDAMVKKLCCDNKEMPGNCCRNEAKVIKLKDNYAQSQTVNVPSNALAAFVLISIQTFHLPLIDNQYTDFFSNHHAPPEPVSLSILYRSILI